MGDLNVKLNEHFAGRVVRKDLTKKIKDFTKEELNIILYGTNKVLDYEYVSKNGNKRYVKDTYEGIVNNYERRCAC